MDSTVNVGMFIRAGVMIAGIMAIFFVLALITPRLARFVDRWIENYRSKRTGTRDSVDYGIRSIYELPPRKAAPPPGEGDMQQEVSDASEDRDK